MSLVLIFCPKIRKPLDNQRSGILASAVKGKKLYLCRKLLKINFVPKERLSVVELIKELTGKDITLCPVCGSKLTRAAPEILTA